MSAPSGGQDQDYCSKFEANLGYVVQSLVNLPLPKLYESGTVREVIELNQYAVVQSPVLTFVQVGTTIYN